MKENKWVSVNDRCPIEDQIVLVACKDCPDIIEEAKFIPRFESTSNKIRLLPTFFHVTHWCHIPEKRLEFSELKKGVALTIAFLDNEEKENKTTFIFDSFSTSLGYLDGCILSQIPDETLKTLKIIVEFFNPKIKKITRINIEEKTFEEI